MISKKEKLVPILLYLTVITTVAVSRVSFSKFESTSKGTGEVEVAAFIVDASGSGVPLEINCNAETSEANYDVVVTNEKEGKVSAVSIKYDVILEFDTALPSGMKISDGTTTLDTTEGKKTYIFEDMGRFDAGAEKKNTHRITISGSKDVLYSCHTVMSVYVDATQID